jgi:hypothetical protein
VAPAAAESQHDLAYRLNRAVDADAVLKDLRIQVERLTAPAKLDPKRGSLTEVAGRRLDHG